jgi:hypothetical protein
LLKELSSQHTSFPQQLGGIVVEIPPFSRADSSSISTTFSSAGKQARQQSLFGSGRKY